jgi:hypothetical protein
MLLMPESLKKFRTKVISILRIINLKVLVDPACDPGAPVPKTPER